MELKSCSFTGHRSYPDSHRKVLAEHLKRAVEYAYSLGCREFYAGGAIGFDTLAAREIIRFRISHPDVSLILLLPCLNQSEKWSGSDADAYDYILSEADEVRYFSDTYTRGCMQKRNKALAEVCDIMIAYLSRSRSGAAQTVRMAEELEKKVYNLYPSVEQSAKE